jgi:acyl-CoA synthetase (AMP-forming)/AMP-acid ligase II
MGGISLNRSMMLLSEQHGRFDLSSLKVVQYTTEVMPESTLRRFHEVFPDVRLVQSYGASEVSQSYRDPLDSGSSS